MALGDLTKALAKEALGHPLKDVLDALRPADLSKISEAARAAKPPVAGPAENMGATILGQVQAMQKALKEDEELVALCTAGAETIRVLEIHMPSWSVAVVTGIDTAKNVTRVVSPVEALQLVCRAMKVEAGAKPIRIGMVAPKPKPAG